MTESRLNDRRSSMIIRRSPHLIEINARTFVARMSAKYERQLTLVTIPDEEWRSLAKRGFDLVWLMGVWQRSPTARQQALSSEGLRYEMERLLPDFTPEDVGGSPYAVYGYVLDPPLGREGDLAQLKAKLNRFGLALILDFVPNHLAMDHPWTLTYPGRFVRGRPRDIKKHLDWFFPSSLGINLAHGRDPYFPSWHDTVQVNFYSASSRRALSAELGRIASQADGARCDMAMLALNEVFERVWGEVVRPRRRPRTEFWAEAIKQARKQRQDFLLMAEVYWGYEQRLQEIGFDFTYDKTLYDRLRYSSATDISAYLKDTIHSMEHSAHFTENHDEPRAVVVFGSERSMAAAVVLGTLPGLRFFQDGQLEGRAIRIPVQLAREPDEPDDPEIKAFFERLLPIIDAAPFHDGDWSLIEPKSAWEGNETHRDLLAWEWRSTDRWKVVAINYSDHQSQGWVGLSPPSTLPERVEFLDELTGITYLRDRAELVSKGLYVDLRPYQSHIMDTTVR